jgi:hypothetical protein
MIAVWSMLAGLALGVAPDAVAGTLTLPVAEIEPVRAERLVAHAPLRGFLLAFEERGRAVLCIRHAGGEVPTRRAEALREALVSLGIPSARLALEPAAAGVDELVLEIVANGDSVR